VAKVNRRKESGIIQDKIANNPFLIVISSLSSISGLVIVLLGDDVILRLVLGIVLTLSFTFLACIGIISYFKHRRNANMTYEKS